MIFVEETVPSAEIRKRITTVPVIPFRLARYGY